MIALLNGPVYGKIHDWTLYVRRKLLEMLPTLLKVK